MIMISKIISDDTRVFMPKKKKKIKSHYLPESVTDKEDNFIIILLPNSFINNI